MFQAKRKIDDLEEEVEDLRKELDDEKLKKNSNTKQDDPFTMDDIENNLETIELQTEIASLKAKLASKDIVIDELNIDNDKWQDAHDSIFERMTEAQTRLAKEIEEFEDAKKFYENKLSVLRDKLQDNQIQFWQYQQRINEITKQYETDTNGKKLSEWKDKPNINYDGDENMKSKRMKERISIQLNGNLMNEKQTSRNSMSESIGWGKLTPAASNHFLMGYDHNGQGDAVLYDQDEDDEDANGAFGALNDENEEEITIEDSDANGAFGAVIDDIIDDNKNKKNGDIDDEEFGCEEDDDGVNAFGGF